MDVWSIENSFELVSAFREEIIWLSIKERQGARNTEEHKLGLSCDKLNSGTVSSIYLQLQTTINDIPMQRCM